MHAYTFRMKSTESFIHEASGQLWCYYTTLDHVFFLCDMLPLFWRERGKTGYVPGVLDSLQNKVCICYHLLFFFLFVFFLFFYFMHFIYFQICLFYFDIKFSFILGYAQRRLNMIGYILVSDYVLVW